MEFYRLSREMHTATNVLTDKDENAELAHVNAAAYAIENNIPNINTMPRTNLYKIYKLYTF